MAYLIYQKWSLSSLHFGGQDLFILSFSRIHFRIFAISVKTSSIFKTFFFSRMLLSSSRPSFFFYIFFCFFSLCILKGFPCACILGWIFEEIKLAEKVAKHARTHYPQMLTINLTYVQLYSTIFSTKTKKPKMSKRRIQTMSSK